jgi:membrane complex biogenesis BtpA family protein
MIHLRALPGAPGYRSMIDVIEAARRDAAALQEGGVPAVMIENFGDRPFFKRVGGETIAAMSRVIGEIARELSVPFGVNVLRNDGVAAMAVAAATGASFVRVNVLVGAMLTDQGVIEGEAATVLRERQRLCPEVLLFGDHMVKHATPLAAGDPLQMAKDLRLRGLADVLVVSGRETGSPIDLERVKELRGAIDAPIVAGSGLTRENAAGLAAELDGAIVGTSIKENGAVDAPVDVQRVRELVAAFS